MRWTSLRKTRGTISGVLCVASCPTAFALPALKRELFLSHVTQRGLTVCRHALSVQKSLQDRYIPEITAIEYDGAMVEPPTPVPWYPDKLAWQMTTPKNVIRRFPPFKSFQKFLVSETTVGNISRQEVVSMIPPLLLDVKPGMIVLDLCAAPGSKAAQLIELVHAGEEVRMQEARQEIAREELGTRNDRVDEESTEDGQAVDYGRATGLLIANDSDWKRAHMLVHQMKRLNSPNLIVTNHDAAMYPSIKMPSNEPQRFGAKSAKYLKFDRILADVPCSGDGTCRKNPNVWRDWNPGNGLGLYPMQVRILSRALQLLKVGGRVVYSTCSMNPVENEAVVASAIERCGGLKNVQILDCNDALPKLERCPGLKTWKVMDKQGYLWQSWSDIEEQRVKQGQDMPSKVLEGMFPSSDSSNTNKDIHLERCMRIYSHLQDTGGFFVAVLEKRSEIKLRASEKLVPKSSIFAAVEEIESKPFNSADPVEHIEALDEILPPQKIEEVGNASATARQNQENMAQESTSSLKRELVEVAEAEKPTKRVKYDDGVNGNALEVLENAEMQPSPLPEAPEGQLVTKDVESTPPNQIQLIDQQRPKNNQPYEEPFKYLDSAHEELQSVYSFYNLHPRFPRDRFMVRNAAGNPAKTIYYTSELARNVLVENEGKGIKFVHCGIKMFVKQDVQKVGVCKWRIQTEGLPIVEAWVGQERIVRLWNRDTFRYLLVEMFPKVGGLGWQSLGEIGERVRDIDMGCCVLRVDKTDDPNGFRYGPWFLFLFFVTAMLTSHSENMVLSLWRSLQSLNLMLPKEDRKAMLLRLYNDDSPLMDNSKDRFTIQTRADSPEVVPEDNTMKDDIEVDVSGDVVVSTEQEVLQANEELAEARKTVKESRTVPEVNGERDTGTKTV